MGALSFRFVLLLATGLSLAGCSHQPLDEEPDQFGEIPDGPGLFSGAEGGFDLIGSSRQKRRN
jgi:hypothetical protein